MTLNQLREALNKLDAAPDTPVLIGSDHNQLRLDTVTDVELDPAGIVIGSWHS